MDEDCEGKEDWIGRVFVIDMGELGGVGFFWRFCVNERLGLDSL